MRVEFKLTMPRNNAWNGKWSGRQDNYLLHKEITGKKAVEIGLREVEMNYKHGFSVVSTKTNNIKNSWMYDFGDGWLARVNARIMDKGERKSKSAGFCGYDWMVDSILRFDEILDTKGRVERYEEEQKKAETP